jgi:teichuronic acid biosynthesis protein TuaE
MNWKTVAYIGIFALIFLDSFFINIPIGPLRITLLRIFILALLVFWAYRVFFGIDRFSLKSIRFPLTYLGFWFCYGVLSILWAKNKVTGIKELYYFALFLVLILVLIYLLHLKIQNNWIPLSFWLFGLGIILICIVEFALNIHLPTSRFVVEADRFTDLKARRATAFFYNENDLSVFFVIAFPFYLTGLLNKSIFYKLVSFAGIIAIIAINYFNDARLSVGANLLQIFFFILLTRKNVGKKVLRLMLLFSPLLLGIVVAGGVYILQKGNILSEIEASHGSAFIRMNLYLDALYATFHSFMLGVGPGNFQYFVYPQFNTMGIVNPHNWWFEILTNYGFIVLMGYCCFFVFIVKRIYSIYRLDRINDHVALGLLLSFIGFIPACLAPSSLFYFWPMWLLYGIALAFINQERTS